MIKIFAKIQQRDDSKDNSTKFCENEKTNYFCALKKIKFFILNYSLIIVYVKSLRDRFHRNSRFV